MNPAEYLDILAEVIDSHKPYAGGTYLLSVFEGKFHIHRRQNAIAGYESLALLLSRDLNEGLTVELWDRIQDKIAVLMNKGFF